ncbi:MAG: TolC family protein [Bacteroidota bacterium]
MHIQKWILLGLLLLSFLMTSAQPGDSVLTYQRYLKDVLQYHPMAKQARLRFDLAEAEWLMAKGMLDPMLTSDWNQKNFDNKLYYRHVEGKLQVPTPLGIDIVGGYENMDGLFLNPENTLDPFGLWNVGIEANLIQGLFVNERRTAMQQARIFQNMARNQQQQIINELLYAASAAYLYWQQYFYFESILEENIELARQYFANTRTSFFSGEQTAMDTLEALILVQDAGALLQGNAALLLKARQQMENFLWFDDQPLILQNSVIPEDYRNPIFQPSAAPRVEEILAMHPILQEKFNKRAMLEVEQRLKREKLKPKLKAKYNPLIATSENSIRPNFSAADVKWGFDFSFPLFLRSERAAIQKGAIKIQEVQLDIENKQNELRNKIENSWRQQDILQRQLVLIAQNVEGYRLLLEGENQKFRFGESSVFLLNRRQEKYIQVQLKQIKLNIDLQVEVLNYLFFSNGLIGN